MNSLKLPVNLVWGLLTRIFDDLSLESLCEDLFKQNKCNPSNGYEIIYGLLLVLLKETKPLCISLSEGVTENVQNYSLDKTIRLNTLANCTVWGRTMEYDWFCLEHAIFIEALQICESKSSKFFINRLKSYRSSLESYCQLNFSSISLDQIELYNVLKSQFNFETFEFSEHSLMLRNENLYKNLCILAYLVLGSENSDTSKDGSSLLNYNKLDYILIQLYGVKEIWRNINNIKQLSGKKHYMFDREIAHSFGGSLRPDAIYYFDSQPLKDILVDVKLYANPCVENEVYRYRNNFNQVTTYALAYPSFINSKKVGKNSRKQISYIDVNAWILHFRTGITSQEQKLNGMQLFNFSPVRVYSIDMSENRGIEYLDEQIKIFVNTYLVKALL